MSSFWKMTQYYKFNVSTIISHLAVISKPMNKCRRCSISYLCNIFLVVSIIELSNNNANGKHKYLYVRNSFFIVSHEHNKFDTQHLYVIILVLYACAVSYFLCHTNIFNLMYHCLSIILILHV